MARPRREDMSYLRDDFWATTSNKQLNFLQHVRSLLDDQRSRGHRRPGQRAVRGRRRRDDPPAAAGRVRRAHAAAPADRHLLRRGVKANVLFFDRKPPSENPWTQKLWIYDFRTNQRFTLKTRALVRS